MVHVNRGKKNRKRNRRRKQICAHKEGTCAKCSGMSDFERDQTIRFNIKKYGWHLTGVGPSESSPNFTYSIGLTEKGFSELIIFGLPMKLSAYFINMIGNELLGGKAFKQDVSHFGYTEGNHPFMLLDVSQNVANKYMFDTKNYYSNYKTQQFIWTDSKSKYPWEKNFDNNFKKDQPILGTLPGS